MRMRAVWLLGALALLGTPPAIAQPADDPWADPGSGAGSAPDPTPVPDPVPADPGPGSAAGSGSGSDATGSGADTTAGSGSGSGSGSASKPTIIQIPTDANAPEVSAAAGVTEIQLGKKFTLFVTATYNAGVVVNLREPLELGPAFEVTRKLSEDKPTGDGRTQREWQIEVIAWDLGDLVLPPIAVTYTAFGKADQVATNRVRLRVVGLLGDVVDDPKAVRKNADPRELLSRDWFWLWVTIAGVVAAGLVVGGALYLRARRRRRMIGGAVVMPRGAKLDTPSARALARLLEIERSGALDRDDDRKHGYTEMVEVIREYLGSRYRVATHDLTSCELLARLAGVAPEGEHDRIELWLGQCDIVKYGGFRATAADAHRTLDDGRTLVVSTTADAARPAGSIASDPGAGAPDAKEAA